VLLLLSQTSLSLCTALRCLFTPLNKARVLPAICH